MKPLKVFTNKYFMPLILVLSGALTSLPLIFPSMGFLQWVSMIPAAIILILSADNEETKLRKIYGRGLLYFWSFYAVSFHWFFYMYPLDFAGLSNAASIAVVLVACFGLSLFQAIWSAFAFMLFAKINRIEMVQSFGFAKPFFAAALYVVFEWWQTVGWWGVPWGRLPLGQINATFLLRSSALFGSYFVTFAIVAVNFCLAYLIISRDARRYFAVAATVTFAVNLALSSCVTLFYKKSGAVVRVSAAQGNISSSDKWDAHSLENTKQVYCDLTRRAADDGADIVVWPETALPYDLFSSIELCEYVSELAKENNITLIVSAFTEDEETGLLANSMIEVRPDGSFGESIYSKQRLVPFGEFVPMRELVMKIFPPLANVGMLDDDLAAGDESTVLPSRKGYIGCGVCFDSIYETVILESVRNGAQFIAISTNDSWFSDSAALDMHNSQSRLRAIETGRYIVRSANTGISSIIDPMGNVEVELGALERGYVISDIELRDSRTLYSTVGNVFVYLCIGLPAALLVLDRLAKRSKSK